MLKLASDDPRKRAMQGPRITPIQAPRPVAPPKQEEGIASRFAQAAMNRGIDTAVEGGAGLAKKYGKPLLDKGIAAVTPAAAAPTQAAIASNAAATGTAPALMQSVMGTAPATAGASTGLMSSLGSAGTAAMASPAAPIVGGLLAMKLLGFFSEGGHVGPLNKMSYKSAGGDVMTMSYGGPLKKGV
jgi:hypothetical protein